MPSILEYWTTMPYSTCNNYLKRYTDVAALKAGIQRHAFSNGVQINIGEDTSDIECFRQAIPKQKRPIAKNILEAPRHEHVTLHVGIQLIPCSQRDLSGNPPAQFPLHSQPLKA